MWAAYWPSAQGAFAASIPQVILIGILATALGAYAMRGHYLPRIAGFLAGGCLAGDVVGLLMSSLNGEPLSFYAFFELWRFAIFSAIGLVVGFVVLEASGREIPDLIQTSNLRFSFASREDRIIRLSRIDPPIMASLGSGVVFLDSPWSGQARVAQNALLHILCEQRFLEVSLHVVADGGGELPLETFHGMVYGGYGETFWIKNGKIIGKMSNYSEADSDVLTHLTESVHELSPDSRKC